MPSTFFPEIPTKLTRGVPLPTYAHDGDAGLDLCATEDVTLYPGESCKMGSGVAMAIPYGFCGVVIPRSGLGTKGLVIKNGMGLIDSTYRGEIGLTLFNNNPPFVSVHAIPKTGNIFQRLCRWIVRNADCRTFVLSPNNDRITIHKGDRVAQLVIIPIAIARLLQVDELDSTDRNEGGFGSTGITGGPRP